MGTAPAIEKAPRVIEVIDLTARRRGRTTLDMVGFDVRPGQVTGVLGAAGAGKSTLIRRMVQLEGGGGRTLFDGRQYRSLRHPIREVGLVLGPHAVRAEGTVGSRLRLALSTDRRAARDRSPASRGGRLGRLRNRPGARIEAVLDIVGLAGQSGTPLGCLTEGMATRLSIALALLGDPKALLLDCPDRTLEPGGADWLASLLRAFTAQGRAALITGDAVETLTGLADRLLLLDAGRLVGSRTAQEIMRARGGTSVVVRSPQIVRLASLLGEAGARMGQGDGAALEVRGLTLAHVGDLAFRHGVPLHELAERFTGTDPADHVLIACSGKGAALPAQNAFGARRVAPLWLSAAGAEQYRSHVRLIEAPAAHSGPRPTLTSGVATGEVRR